MATGFPAATGDVLSAAMYNGLVAYTVNADQTADYTPVLADGYQALISMNKATAVNFTIPTNASVAYPTGTVLTVLNKGAGAVTIKAVTSGTTTVLSAGAVAAQPTLAQYKTAACIKVATDTWYVASTAFESIATASGTGSSNTITFSSIPSTYQHLQIRSLVRSTFAATGVGSFRVRLNGDTGSNYAWHFIYASGTSVSATGAASATFMDLDLVVSRNNNTAGIFGAMLVDIHDYASTTIRSFSGVNQNSATASEQSIGLESGLWISTSAITRLDITSGGGNWKTGSTFALYGIKGA